MIYNVTSPTLNSWLQRIPCALGVLFAAVLTMACGATHKTSGGLQVVATTSIVGDVVAAIGGEAIRLTVLLPRGTDPHSFEPSPRDLVTLSDADVVFKNGAGLEDFLEPLLGAANVELSVIDLSAGIETRILEQGEIRNHRHASHNAMEKATVDPHVWLNPLNVVKWTQNIEAALTSADSANTDHYASRADSLRTLLESVDVWIQEQLNVIPRKRRLLVSDHAALGYFADRYDFTQVGAIYPGFSTLSEPSARELSRLEDTMQALSVSAIFVGTTVNPRLAQQLADDIGIGVVRLYIGSLSTVDGPAPSYLSLLQYNVRAIARALSEE